MEVFHSEKRRLRLGKFYLRKWVTNRINNYFCILESL